MLERSAAAVASLSQIDITEYPYNSLRCLEHLTDTSPDEPVSRTNHYGEAWVAITTTPANKIEQTPDRAVEEATSAVEVTLVAATWAAVTWVVATWAARTLLAAVGVAAAVTFPGMVAIVRGMATI